MFRHKPSGTIFSNRQQCRKVMGNARYKQALAQGEFEFNNAVDKQDQED